MLAGFVADTGGGWKFAAQLLRSSAQKGAAKILMLVIVVVLLSWRRWLFEPKLFVPHMTAGISDVAADTERGTSDDKRCDRERQ